MVLLEERRERCAVARRKIGYVMLCYVEQRLHVPVRDVEQDGERVDLIRDTDT